MKNKSNFFLKTEIHSFLRKRALTGDYLKRRKELASHSVYLEEKKRKKITPKFILNSDCLNGWRRRQ